MVDRGVVVDELVVPPHVETVQRAVDAFAVQRGDDVVPHEAAPEGERVRREIAAARAVEKHAGDVERIGRLFLQLVVVDNGVRAQPHFGDSGWKLDPVRVPLRTRREPRPR